MKLSRGAGLMAPAGCETFIQPSYVHNNPSWVKCAWHSPLLNVLSKMLIGQPGGKKASVHRYHYCSARIGEESKGGAVSIQTFILVSILCVGNGKAGSQDGGVGPFHIGPSVEAHHGIQCCVCSTSVSGPFGSLSFELGRSHFRFQRIVMSEPCIRRLAFIEGAIKLAKAHILVTTYNESVCDRK